MRYLVALALFAPASALACAMPPSENRDLARLMAEIDEAAVPAPAPEVAAKPAPTKPADPAVQAPREKASLTVIAEVDARPDV